MLTRDKHYQLSRLESTVRYQRNARLVSAQNDVITISDGEGRTRELIDIMSSYAAVNFGHLNPHINPFGNLRADLVSFFAPEEAELYAKWICDKTGRPDGRVLFQVGGTSAVSAAISLSQQHRPGKVMSVQGGFHGLAIDALPASDISRTCIIQDTNVGRSIAGNYVIIDYGTEVTDWSGISCLLFEPVQGAAGMLPLEQQWLKDLCASARQNGVVTIADEIQCGYFRCGALSYSKSIGLDTDIILFGKSMTNGLFPFSCVVYDAKLDIERMATTGAFAHTFQPSAIGCYCAYEVAKYIDEHRPLEKSANIHEALGAFCSRLQEEGLVDAIQLLGPSASMEYVAGRATEVADDCFARGVLITTGGREDSRFRLMPPLTISHQNLTHALDTLGDSIRRNRTR